jgi:hypothetical protein
MLEFCDVQSAPSRAIKGREGIAESEQIRRGIQLWLKKKGVAVKKSERKRPAGRKRP